MKATFGELRVGDAFFVPVVWRKDGAIDAPVLLFLGDSWIVNEGEVYKTSLVKAHSVVIVRREE